VSQIEDEHTVAELVLGLETNGHSSSVSGDVGVIDTDVRLSVVRVDQTLVLSGTSVDVLHESVGGIGTSEEVKLVEEGTSGPLLGAVVRTVLVVTATGAAAGATTGSTARGGDLTGSSAASGAGSWVSVLEPTSVSTGVKGPDGTVCAGPALSLTVVGVGGGALSDVASGSVGHLDGTVSTVAATASAAASAGATS